MDKNYTDIKIDIEENELKFIDEYCNKNNITRDEFFEKVMKDYIKSKLEVL